LQAGQEKRSIVGPQRAGPPAGAQLTVEGTGGSNATYLQGNNTLAGSNKFLDEGSNTSQVAPGACGSFPVAAAAPTTVTATAPDQGPPLQGTLPRPALGDSLVWRPEEVRYGA
jgi:hypothetical protein